MLRSCQALGTSLLALRKRLLGLHAGEGGQVFVIGALAMVVLTGVAGLAIDGGIATVHRRATQNAADASALAGADDLTGPGQTPTPAQVAVAITDAYSWARKNGYTSTNGNCNMNMNPPPKVMVCVQSPPEPLLYPRFKQEQSEARDGDVHSVEVTIIEQVPTLLLGVLEKNNDHSLDNIQVVGDSVATGFGSYITKPNIALLDPLANESLDVGITGWVNYPVNINIDGPLTVNSNDGHEAEQVHNNYHFNSPTNAVRGRIDQLGDGTIGPSSQKLNSPIPDPLGSLAEPNAANDPNYSTFGVGFKCPAGTMPIGGGSCTNGGTPIGCDKAGPPESDCIVHHYNEMVYPGVWNDLIVDDDGSITMQPGTYIITGSLQLVDGADGPGNITGNGVTLFFACSSSTAPYWKPCAPVDCSKNPGSCNAENVAQPGGFMNVTGAGPSGIAPSVDSNPHILQGTYTLTAPKNGYYHGLLFFNDRGNYDTNFGASEDHPTQLQIEGNSNDTLTGTIYGATARGLYFSSTKGSPWNIDSCFVLGTLEMDGNADYNIGCSQANNYYAGAGAGSATLTE